jgi:hypothetical protein
MNRHRLMATLLVTGALSGVAAGAACADSIAYIKNGNVWLTTADASREFQVTSTGGYSAVSQADDGTLLATAGGDLRRLDRVGTVLSDIKPPVSDDPGTGLSIFYGPFNADISPDGKTAAYGYDHSGWTTGSDGYTDFEQTNGSGFTRSTALTGFTDAGYKYSEDWDAPEFIDNSTVVVSDGPGYPSDPIAVETVGSGDPQGWFTDPDNPHPLDATVSRNKRLIADVVGPDRQALAVYRDQDAQPLGPVSKCFTYSGDTGTYTFESPTFNADGTMLYWSNGSQLEIAPIGDMSTTCAAGQNSRAAIPGATSPDWGPADVPTGRPTPGPGPGPVGPNSPVKTHPTPAGAKLALVALPKASLARALRNGIAVPVLTKAVGTVNVTARSGKTTVARGRVHAAHAGRVVVHLSFTRAARRHYRHAHGLTLALIATQAGRHATGALRLH